MSVKYLAHSFAEKIGNHKQNKLILLDVYDSDFRADKMLNCMKKIYSEIIEYLEYDMKYEFVTKIKNDKSELYINIKSDTIYVME
ncbi:MAG: hypothetical protein A2X09_14180 [Bacteroidetes bacterium GWF2_43_11]|nr:MAG: hypothetical protein A2X09_14180 [Bacteroidetes bacterium GWF2_43_11]